MARLITNKHLNDFDFSVYWELKKLKTETEEEIRIFRKLFFDSFHLSDWVEDFESVAHFQTISENFYNRSSVGYNGIITEIKDRTDLLILTDGKVEVREFLRHAQKQTDIYDRENKEGWERKTGTGDWLISEKANTLDEVLAEYRRKRTKIWWTYSYTARSEGMIGKKSVNKFLPDDEKQEMQKRKKSKPCKEYDIEINIQTTYRELFDYMQSYPSGIKTFFKESYRSNRAGLRVWELQTLKNSKKKIDFLESFGKTSAKKEEEEEE